MRAELVRILLIAALANVAACAQGSAEPRSPATKGAPSGLEGKWLTSGIAGDRGPPWIELRKGKVSGHAGCNSFGGSYSVTAGGGLAFGPMTTSKKLCTGNVMQGETRLLDALRRAAGTKIDGDRLELRDARKAVLLRLERAR